jgi:GNAT superfamily N-acetyltransferase
MTQLSIRPATADDIPLVFRFVCELAEYERLSHLVVATEDSLREALFGSRPGAEVLLAFAGETPVGFAVYFHNFSTFLGVKGLWLEDIYVRPEHRRKGFGRALLLHLARIAVERGCGRFEWTALDWNTPAWDFYKSLGAQPMEDWTIFRVTGEALRRLGAAGAGDGHVPARADGAKAAP